MRWFVLAVGLLAAALGGLVLAAPVLLDFNRLRPEIAALAGDALGRSVRIDGAVSLALVPEVMVTAGKVTFSQDTADGEGVMTADELRLKVAPAALLAGRVEARELVLRGMDLHLPWPLPPAALMIRRPEWLSSLSARVERGRVRIGTIELSDVSATLTTADVTGTYQAAGTATLMGRPLRFSVQLSQPGGDGAVGLDVRLDGLGPTQGSGASLTGQVDRDGGFAGRIALRGNDLSQLLPAPALAFRAEGRLSVAGGLAAADELVGELGAVPVRGAMALRVSPVPRLDLALTASRLDLDGWWAAIAKPRAVVPGGLAIGLDVSAEAAQFAGGTLRGVRAAFDLAGGTLDLRELRAVLPGEASLRAAGSIGLPALGQPPRFDGFVALTAPTLGATLSWLLPNAPAGPRQAALSGHVVAEPGFLSVDGLTGSLDETAAEGAASIRLAARPVVKAALKFGRLDLAPWLGRATRLTDAAAVLGAIDADVRLDLGTLALGTTDLHDVTIDAATEPGRATLRRFEAAVGPARVDVAGTLLEGSRLADTRLSLAVPADGLRDAALLPLLPDWLIRLVPPAAAVWRAPLTLDAQASGGLPALAAKLTLQIGDLRLEASPTGDIASGKWASTVALRHPGAPRLLEALGIIGTPAWLGDGSLGVVAQLQGDPARIAADSFEVSAGALRAAGALALARTALSGRIEFDTLPLPLPYLRATQPFPVPDLTDWDVTLQLRAAHVLLGLSPLLADARGQLDIHDRKLRLGDVTARMAGGALAGTLTGDLAPTPATFALTAKLDGATLASRLLDLPLDLEAGHLNATADLTAAGYSPGGLLATLGGTLHMGWTDGVLLGIAMDRLAAPFAPQDIAEALAGGASGFDRLDMDVTLAHGTLNFGAATLAGPAGTIRAEGSVDLPSATEELRLTLQPAGPEPPRLALRLSGPLATPQRTPETADLIRWRAANAP